VIFFTSDQHFGHKRIIELADRPFSSVGEMDRVMIERWNDTVGERDTVYQLGDFSFRKHKETAQLFSQLNGKICCVCCPSHHDRFWYQYFPRMKKPLLSASGERVERYPAIYVHNDLTYTDDDGHPKAIVLSHFPLAIWEQQQYGSWHLHGHTHGCPVSGTGRRMDVSVECTDYAPVSLDDVSWAMLACPERTGVFTNAKESAIR